MDREQVEQLAIAEVGAVKEMLWNCHATWPADFEDKEQNPHGRPIDYWCPTVGGQRIGWEGVSGWSSKNEALSAARKFRQKCIDWLAEHSAN